MKRKITTFNRVGASFEEVYTSFVISKTSLGLSEKTILNYKYHLRTVARYIDISMPFDSLSKRDLELMVVQMRDSGLAHNTIATNVRFMRTFLHWCQDEGLTDLDMPNIKEKDTVREAYASPSSFFTSVISWIMSVSTPRSSC